MRLVSCEHPKRVWNKYLNEYVWTSCGECSTCVRRYQARWNARLESERKSSLFTLFVTLTYNEESLPRLVRSDMFDSETGKLVEAYKDAQDSFLIPFKDFIFDEKSDLDYFNDKMAHGGVPFPRFRDVQLFLKRYNKFLYKHYTQHYENFRYFICAELGKESLRPHYHGLFFFKSQIQAANFEQDISSCWKLGNCKVEYVESTACSYVSKYVGKASFYPSFYRHRQISPKFICSKRPPLGSMRELSKSPKEIFDKCLTHVPLSGNDGRSISMAPLPLYAENRLFPKCPRFSSISHSCRVALYGCASRFQGTERKGALSTYQLGKCGIPEVFHSFNDWLWCLKNIFLHYLHYASYEKRVNWFRTSFWYMLSEIADNFSETGVNALRRLYYLSKRVCKACKEFGLSLDTYVCKIETYFDKKQYEILTQFYNFQQDYAEKNSSEELINMYSEFSFLNPSDLPTLSECRDYRDMCLDNQVKQRVSLISHLKNAFLDSSRCVDKISKSITLKFYYAKKCNEIIEAVT